MNHIREKVAWAIAGVLALAVAAALSGVIEGGPLEPSGPPAPTDGVRSPGTPISSLPFNTTSPGRHYLTRSLTVTTTGITVTPNDVEIDLNGFTLTTSTNLTAITVVAGATDAFIHDGNIVGGQHAIIQQASEATTNLTIEDVSIHATLGTSITTQENTAIRRCRVVDAGADAIAVGPASSIDSCVVENANFSGILAGADSRVSNCRVADSSAGGASEEAIQVGNDSVVDTCSVSGTGGPGVNGGDGVTVRNVSVRNGAGPTGTGITLGDGARVSGCRITSVAAGGIVTANYALIERCSVTDGLGRGIATGARSTVWNSVVSGFSLDGIVAVSGTLIDGNVVSASSDGIEAGAGNRILNNVLRSNAAAGIHLTSTANHVDGNTLTLNNIGLLSDSGNSTVTRNTARLNGGGNYALAADDLQGVVITLANMLSSTISLFNYAP